MRAELSFPNKSLDINIIYILIIILCVLDVNNLIKVWAAMANLN